MSTLNVEYEVQSIPQDLDRMEFENGIDDLVEEWGGEHIGAGMMMMPPFARDMQYDLPEGSEGAGTAVERYLTNRGVKGEVEIC